MFRDIQQSSLDRLQEINKTLVAIQATPDGKQIRTVPNQLIAAHSILTSGWNTDDQVILSGPSV
jgi:hypothetical protein